MLYSIGIAELGIRYSLVYIYKYRQPPCSLLFPFFIPYLFELLTMTTKSMRTTLKGKLSLAFHQFCIWMHALIDYVVKSEVVIMLYILPITQHYKWRTV